MKIEISKKEAHYIIWALKTVTPNSDYYTLSDEARERLNNLAKSIWEQLKKEITNA